ncbi:MAG: flavodoxin family protein [Armatimonadetes bacterium]|nr:flavodoxin family protein [Armatimonadota bacterium]
MRALIVFDTRHGNTKQIAEAIAEGLGSSWEVIVKQAVGTDLADLNGIDLLVTGCPVHGWNISKPMRKLLDRLEASGLDGGMATAFDTKFKHILAGGAAKKLAGRLGKLGLKMVAEPESFFVAGMEGPLQVGELDRARAFGEQLAARVVAGLNSEET